jgi:glycine hydroxymethyltransferase
VKPGDTVLAMSLPHGGHLTHGSKVNFSGKWFNIVAYGVREGHRAHRLRPGARARPRAPPKMIICGATAYPRLIDFAAFRSIADEVGRLADGRRGALHRPGGRQGDPEPGALRRRRLLHHPQGPARPARRDDRVQGRARRSHRQGRLPVHAGRPAHARVAAKAVALKEAATPAYQAYARQVIANAQALADGLAAEGMRPVSGGTDTHLALLDLRGLGVTGTDAETRCDAARITLNKNSIPYDPQPPSIGSGIRVGTPAVTTQGMVEGDMKEIAELIGRRAVRDGPTASSRQPSPTSRSRPMCGAFAIRPRDRFHRDSGP